MQEGIHCASCEDLQGNLLRKIFTTYEYNIGGGQARNYYGLVRFKVIENVTCVSGGVEERKGV